MSRSGSAKGETSQPLGDLFHEEIDWASLLRAVQGTVRAGDDAHVPAVGLAGDGVATAFLAALLGRIEESGQLLLADSPASGNESESPEADQGHAETSDEEGATEGSTPDDATQPAEALPFTDPELAAMFADLQAQLPAVRAMIDAAVVRAFPTAHGHSSQAPGIFAGDAPEGSASLLASLPLPHIFPPVLPVDLAG